MDRQPYVDNDIGLVFDRTGQLILEHLIKNRRQSISDIAQATHVQYDTVRLYVFTYHRMGFVTQIKGEEFPMMRTLTDTSKYEIDPNALIDVLKNANAVIDNIIQQIENLNDST